MAATNIREVLSKPHDQRKDFEVRSAADWLRSTVRHFKGIKDNIMWKLVEEGSTKTFERDQLIILEGDLGDVMYVLLSGQVSVYRKREMIETSDERKEGSALTWKFGSQKFFPERGVFGEDVACLATSGIIFGEIALIEDAPRSASIIANVNTQLFAISRDLFSTTVSEFVAREFREKNEFINHTPVYQNWAPRFKKQLAMAMNVAIYDYQTPIVKQGEPVKGLHYVLSGQVALSVMPQQHLSQFGTSMSPEEFERAFGGQTKASEENSGVQDRSPEPPRRLTPNEQRKQRVRRSSNHNRPLEVSLLDGSNESHRTSCFGDAEVVLNFDTYLCTATATERTVVLELNMRSFERLVARRNAVALDLMRKDAAQRLELWLDRTCDKVPFLRHCLERVKELVQSNGRGKNQRLTVNKNGHSSRPNSLSPSRGSSFQLPPNGALVDQYGPGTVFSYIRQKDTERKARKAHESRTERLLDSNVLVASAGVDRPTKSQYQTANDPAFELDQEEAAVAAEEEDDVISGLEARLRVLTQQRAKV